MWNKEFKWFFEEGTPNGFNDGGIAEFASTKYDGLAREIIQNSLDARYDESKPVKVVFEKITLPISYFPDIEGYQETIEKCIAFIKNDIGNKSINDLEKISSWLKRYIKNGEFNILKISDYNTKGLSGSNKTYGSQWANLVRISGNSNKGKGAQGSFGIGKYAPFVFSNIRAIIYSTKDIDGKIAVQGKSILSGHESCGNTRTPFGYFGKKTHKIIDNVLTEHEDSSAIFDYHDIPEEFVRKEVGTSLFVIGSRTPPELMDEIISSVINSFFYSIYNNNLIVEIKDNKRHEEICKENLYDQIQHAISNCPTNKELKTTKDYYSIFKKSDEVKEFEHVFDLENENKGVMKLFLYTGKDIESKSIAHIRNAGMKIEEYSPKSLIPYVGICVTANNEMNEFLTTCEAPKHDSWSSNNCGDEEQQQFAKKILKELNCWERKQLQQLMPINDSDKLDPLGMEEFLPSNIEGEIESNNSKNVENNSYRPLDTRIEKKKKTKQTYLNSKIDDGIIVDENGEELIEGPNGHKKSGNGTEIEKGNGGQAILGTAGEGHRSEKEKIKISNIKTPYMNEPGKYIISFVPEVTSPNCELKVRLAGEDVFENIKIKKMYLLDEHGKSEINTFDVIEQKKITLEVYFDDINRAALEVNCYAKK